jgi:hypothetical protein
MKKPNLTRAYSLGWRHIWNDNINIHLKAIACKLEVFVLLGCYAAKVGSWLPKLRDSLSVPSLKARVCLILECALDS